MIPDAAVEAAVKAWDHHWGDRYGDDAMDEMGEEVRAALEAAAPHMLAEEVTEQDDRVGWHEFIKPGAATTHIAYVHEGGSIYLPEGPDAVTEQDFQLASATNRFWRLVRA